MMRIETALALRRSGACLLAVLIAASPVSAQFFGKRDLFDDTRMNYDQVFQEGLSGGGKTLNLSGRKLGDPGLEKLLEHEAMKKVEKLDLRYNEITEKGARLLAEYEGLARLKSLDLRHNYLLDAGARALAGAGGFKRLEKLNLSFNEIRDQGALALGQSANFPKLKKLDLAGNFLSDETKATLKKDLARLKSLKLF